jgi:tetratricopeptide (TPR) repeat protein
MVNRLRSLLHASPAESTRAETARGWIDLAYEAAYAERYTAAAEAADQGLRAAGGEDPENRLMLLRVLSGVHEMRGDPDAASPYLSQRVDLLRSLGRTRQASIEADLGSILLREPDRVEGEILARVADDLRSGSSDLPGVELADVLSSLAVRVLHDEGPDAALPLVQESCEILHRLERAEALAGARMFLAHTLLLSGEPEQALEVADTVLGQPANRAVRGAMAMLRATVHHYQDRPEDAASNAIIAVELYAACGVRKGAASAAALLAGLAATTDDGETAVLAWKVAIRQAELGEVEESRTLTLALGQQLLDLSQYREAEEVLDALCSQLVSSSSHRSARGRALMGLGHAVTAQKRPLEAMAHWKEAAQLFIADDDAEEAARAYLAAGALASSLERLQSARDLYEKGLTWADAAEDVDPMMLMQALHSLGHVLSRQEDEAGLEYLHRAMRIAQEHGSPWQLADLTDTLARGYTALGRGTEAVSTALNAADLFSQAEDRESAGDAELFAGRVLREMGRHDEAASLYGITATELADHPRILAEALEGQIDAFDSLGKPERAQELRPRLARARRRADRADGVDGADA